LHELHELLGELHETGPINQLTFRQTQGYIYSQAAIGGFFVFRVHILRGLPHGFNHGI